MSSLADPTFSSEKRCVPALRPPNFEFWGTMKKSFAPIPRPSLRPLLWVMKRWSVLKAVWWVYCRTKRWKKWMADDQMVVNVKGEVASKLEVVRLVQGKLWNSLKKTARRRLMRRARTTVDIESSKFSWKCLSVAEDTSKLEKEGEEEHAVSHDCVFRLWVAEYKRSVNLHF